MKSIVYLMDQPLDARNYARFGIDAWLARGWKVEVWDLTPWAYPKVWENFLKRGGKLRDFPGYSPISSRKELFLKFSKSERFEYLLDLTVDNYCELWAKVMLVWRGAERIIWSTAGVSPGGLDPPRPSIAARLQGAYSVGATEPLKRLFAALYRKIAASYYRPKFIVVNGASSIPRDYAGDDGALIKAHHPDYDIYMALSKSAPAPSDNLAVFIDQNFCFHPDFTYNGAKSFVTPEKYFPALRNGFRKLSEDLGVNVRIAAHPRCLDLDAYRGYFAPFPVEFGKTAELIHASKVVVCHQSIAVNFAVLFRKPIIFVTTNEFLGAFEGKDIEDLAFFLGKPVINLDGNLSGVDWKKELLFDAAKYDHYTNTFMKMPGSPEKPAWDIVIDRLEHEDTGIPPLPAEMPSGSSHK